ncbi:tetratricopeptide repeat protein [Fibrobacter sp. UBA4309]|uniref:tetratricopeptide repeat protein n=1 Tax=Fibrobacter sp. UBA4309 TaxID=1946537 RepID=UPI0025BD7013|nr:hypothetical protein [Fibrobacter sp. UBA4309]
MKKFLGILLSFGFLFLCGCNGVGEKDSILARINDEKVYTEDEDLLYKVSPGIKSQDRKEALYENLLGPAALVSRALSEYPELNAEWEQYYKDIDVRILTMVFQRFYVMECLTYSDEELRLFYDTNSGLFPSDSNRVFDRSVVAGEYYIHKNQEAWKEFLGSLYAGWTNVTRQDTLSARDQFVTKRREELRTSEIEKAKDNKRLVVHPVQPMSAEEYYEKHKDKFMTVPGYELYQVQGADSAKLEKLVQGEISLEQFKKIAAKSDKNEYTAKDSGYVGVVKQGYALPYNIGVVRGLDEVLMNREPGFVTPAMMSEITKSYHKFFLVRQVPPEQKPFDRAKADAAAIAAVDGLPELDSSFVLISLDGKPLFTMADFFRFNNRYFHAPNNIRALEYVVRSIVESYSYALVAWDLKLDHTWEYRAIVRDTRAQFIVDSYIDKKISAQVSDDSLKTLYDRMDSVFRERLPFEKAKPELLNYLTLPVNLYKHEYYMGYRMNPAGSTYEQSIPRIYGKRGSEYKIWMKQRWMDEAYASATRHIYDTSVEEHVCEYDPQKLMAKADSLRNAGNRSSAYNTYRKVMNAYATDDSLFEKVAYEMAQVQNENEEYNDAEAEYYAFYTMWPNSPNAEKALFTRGFILDENINNDSLALTLFDEFLKRYPQSELKESVDWLAENIRSGGKLADDLVKKIEAEE